MSAARAVTDEEHIAILADQVARRNVEIEWLREALRLACVDGWADEEGAMRHYIAAARRILEGET